MKKILFAAVITAILAGSCQKEAIFNQADFRLVEKSFNSLQTKTEMNSSHQVLWKNTDSIGVFSGETIYKFTTTDSGSSAVFTGTIPEAASYTAVYPYDQTATISSGKVTAVIPAEQIAVEGSFADNANVAVAYTENSELAFKNVCGLIQFQITGSNVKSVKFVGGNSEAVAGKVEITVSNSPAWSSVEASSAATLVASGTALAPGTYYLAVLPQTYHGFKLVFTDTEGKTAVRSSAKNLVIPRADGQNLGNIDEGLNFREIYALDITKIDFSGSYIYDAKNANGEVMAAVCKEYLGTTANQQAITVYGTTSSRVVNSANPVAFVARVLKEAGAGEYTTYTDVAESDAKHGGVFDFSSDELKYTTAGSKTAIGVVYITKQDDGTTSISDVTPDGFTEITAEPRTLVLSDRGDTKAYKLVKIKRLILTAENLLTAKLNDGTSITKSANAASLNALESEPAYVAVDATARYAYNAAVVKSGKIGPSGWAAPSNTDWTGIIAWGGNHSAPFVYAANNVTGFSSRWAGRVTTKWLQSDDPLYWSSTADGTTKMKVACFRMSGSTSWPTPGMSSQANKNGYWIRLKHSIY